MSTEYLGAAPDVGSVGALDVPLGSPTRPSWRGRLHLLGLIVAVPLVVVLVARADGHLARVGLVVYALGLCSMLAVSTIYHRWVHTTRSRAIWRRADHATIFATIAGTCTPLSLLTFATAPAVLVLTPTWTAAVVGATVKLAGWRRARPIGAALYIGIGWFGVVLVPALVARFGPVPAMLLLAGGVIYTLGAIGFALQWPRLRPSVFSYHEVWHAATIVAAGTHLAAIWLIAT
jgi:hemolysin III